VIADDEPLAELRRGLDVPVLRGLRELVGRVFVPSGRIVLGGERDRRAHRGRVFGCVHSGSVAPRSAPLGTRGEV